MQSGENEFLVAATFAVTFGASQLHHGFTSADQARRLLESPVSPTPKAKLTVAKCQAEVELPPIAGQAHSHLF